MIISVSNLSYSYRGKDSPAISELNFNIQKGEIFGFLGPSGAGKTTTQRILTGLLKDYQGDVKIFDRDLSDWERDYYEHIGVSFELPYHFNKLTAMENLEYFASLYESPTRNIEELLGKLGLLNSAEDNVSSFSKGMKNRLSMARSLLHSPELLFLDEPTAGLDPVNARRIKEIIEEEKDNGSTIFLTTHDMTVASELCDRVSFIVEGKIEIIDNPRQLEIEYGKPTVLVEYDEEGNITTCKFPLDAIGDNEGFNSLLKEKNIKSINTQNATLEDVFIKITGRELL
ncbi:MAG: ABC transporter ATP-binding protein [Halanaerobiales bacterium]